VFIKKYFLFTVGGVCRVKRYHFCGKRFADDEEVETKVRNSSKHFYAADFDALIKRPDKCISVGGEYVEK
jgi:hypothetical protein